MNTNIANTADTKTPNLSSAISSMHARHLSAEAEIQTHIRVRSLFRVERLGNNIEKLEKHLEALKGEWPIETMFATKVGAMTLIGSALGLTGRKRWMLFSAFAGGNVLMQTYAGTSYLYRALRRWGFRTRSEIAEEIQLTEAQLLSARII